MGAGRDPMCRHAGRQAVFEIGSGWHQKGDEKEREILRKGESVMRKHILLCNQTTFEIESGEGI